MRFVCGEPSAENQWREVGGGGGRREKEISYSCVCIADADTVL